MGTTARKNEWTVETSSGRKAEEKPQDNIEKSQKSPFLTMAASKNRIREDRWSI